MSYETDYMLDKINEQITSISEKKDMNEIDYTSLYYCYEQLRVLANYIEAERNQDDISKIDGIIQKFNTITCISPPQVITSLQESINKFSDKCRESNPNDLVNLVAQFNKLSDQLSSTTYTDKTAMSKMKAALDAIHTKLETDISKLPEAERNSIKLNKTTSDALLVKITMQEFNDTYKHTKLIAAGSFGECNIHQYSGNDPKLTSLSIDGYIVLKKALNKNLANENEHFRQEKKSGLETHEREAALAGIAYDGVAIKVDDQIYIATKLLRNDLSENDLKLLTEKFRNNNQLDEAALQAKIKEITSIGSSTKTSTHLDTMSKSLSVSGSTNCTENRAATNMIELLQTFSTGVAKAIDEVHDKGYGHFDFALKNTMVVIQDGQASVKAIDFGFGHQLSNADGSHHTYRQDMSSPMMPHLISKDCLPMPDQNGFCQTYRIEQDLALKKLALLEVVCRLSGAVNFNSMVDDLAKKKEFQDANTEQRFEIVHNHIKQIIDDPGDYKEEIAKEYLSAFAEYFKPMIPGNMNRDEKIESDKIAFAAASASFEQRCVENFSYGSPEKANAFVQSGVISEPPPGDPYIMAELHANDGSEQAADQGYLQTGGSDSGYLQPGGGDDGYLQPLAKGNVLPAAGDEKSAENRDINPAEEGYDQPHNSGDAVPAADEGYGISADNRNINPAEEGYDLPHDNSIDVRNDNNLPQLPSNKDQTPAASNAETNLVIPGGNDVEKIPKGVAQDLFTLATNLKMLLGVKILEARLRSEQQILSEKNKEFRSADKEYRRSEMDLITIKRKIEENNKPENAATLQAKAAEAKEQLGHFGAKRDEAKAAADAVGEKCKKLQSVIAERLPNLAPREGKQDVAAPASPRLR